MHVFPLGAALPSHTQETLLGKHVSVSITARERPAHHQLNLIFPFRPTEFSGWRIKTYTFIEKCHSVNVSEEAVSVNHPGLMSCFISIYSVGMQKSLQRQ